MNDCLCNERVVEAELENIVNLVLALVKPTDYLFELKLRRTLMQQYCDGGFVGDPLPYDYDRAHDSTTKDLLCG